MNHSGSGSIPADVSFLAPPGQVCDWRMVLLHDAAAEAGILDRLPGTPSEVAKALDLDEHAVRVLLEALTAWDIVRSFRGGEYARGDGAPGEITAATLRQHARSLRQWVTGIDDRLHGVPPPPRDMTPARTDLWLQALAQNARRTAPAMVDLCISRLPHARRVLDLGGGHGEHAMEFARRGLAVTMQDRPLVVELASQRGELAAAGVQLFAADFFDRLPDDQFDLVFCTGVTHTMDSNHNLTLYRRLRSVIAPGGTLVIGTLLRGRDPIAALFAVQMLVVAAGGDTHSEKDYRAWLAAAGYETAGVVDVPMNDGRPGRALLFANPR